MTDFLDPFFSSFEVYNAVETLEQLSQKTKLPKKDIIKINANENPYGFPKKLIPKILQAVNWTHYPDAEQTLLRQYLSDYTQTKPTEILAGNGSDEILDIICRFLPQNSKVLIFPPTFSYYEHLIKLNRHLCLKGKRNKDFSLDLNDAMNFKKEKPALVFLCSPNNPTANCIGEEELKFFLKWDAIIVLDEAYFEFSQISHQKFLKKHKNLIIIRTFSKAFALAGLRLGYAMLDSQLQKKFMSLKYPYNTHNLSEVAVKVCLQNFEIFQKQITQIRQTRELVFEKLGVHPKIQLYPSQSNFILCQILKTNTKKIYQQLYKQGIIIRYFDTALLKNFIRFSIGTPSQMKKFIDAMFDILKN